jgi:hypothetical protein
VKSDLAGGLLLLRHKPPLTRRLVVYFCAAAYTVEMTVYGKPEKRWCCFPPFPQTLEIDEADSHISTATTTTGMN